MTRPALPGDCSQWPDDPFELLGLTRPVTARDAKRAYVQRIRQFKPEHHPAEFQRLREAFEKVEQAIRWQDLEAAEDRFTDDGSMERQPSGEPLDSPERPSRHDRISTPNQNSTESAWQLAVAGDPKAAYDRLRRLVDMSSCEPSDASDVLLRLYWLLKMLPALEPDRDARHWLAEGLRRESSPGRCGELYRRELWSDPREAISPRFSQLLHDELRPSLLQQLLTWRWQACVRLKESQTILDDLDGARRRMKFDAEPLWAHALSAAADCLAFQTLDATGWQAFRECIAELESLSHLHRELSYVFDRLDGLTILLREWRHLRETQGVPAEWIALIPLAWLDLYELALPELLSAMACIAERPRMSLESFSRLRETSPLAASRLFWLFRTHALQMGRESPERDAGQFVERAWRFFRNHAAGAYQFVRFDLLEFCLQEMASPEFVVYCMRAAGEFPDELATAIENDGALHAVYAACDALEP